MCTPDPIELRGRERLLICHESIPPASAHCACLEALERRVKQFRRREELWPLRVPSEPILLDDVVEEALGDERRRFDPARAQDRGRFCSSNGTPRQSGTSWMIALPSKTKVYFDSDGHETRVLASGGRNEGDENDRVFLQLLAETAGGGLRNRVRRAARRRACARRSPIARSSSTSS